MCLFVFGAAVRSVDSGELASKGLS